jgi:hypothetical protein
MPIEFGLINSLGRSLGLFVLYARLGDEFVSCRDRRHRSTQLYEAAKMDGDGRRSDFFSGFAARSLLLEATLCRLPMGC